MEKVSSASAAHWDMGRISHKEAENLFRNKRLGTFMVRFSGRKAEYFLHTNNPGKEVRKIKNVNIQGKEYFYTKEGFAFRSLQELIDQNRVEYNLLFPVGCEDSSVLDEDDDNLDIKDMIDSNPEEDNLNHGDICREEAEERLRSGLPGHFLIRSNEDGLKLSYYSLQKHFGHIKIHSNEEDGFYHIKRKFSSIQEISKYYQKEKQWKPLMNTDSEEDKEIPSPMTERINYYHGVLESKDAARLLRGKAEGSFLLRKNPENEYRITYKVSDTK